MDAFIAWAKQIKPILIETPIHIDEGDRINNITRLGSEWAEWKAKKPSDLRDLNMSGIEEDLKDLGAKIVDGWIQS